ncbi:MAG: SIMPL domain-containing protein [Candidatus Zixiibacteriota bacterium]|nr:MAG: SIMPL domain-containing protein [candidate division Zixibacteria bacterium]
MKQYVFIIAAATLWAGVAFAQGEPPRTVTVVGFASTVIMADNVAWHLTVTVKDDDQEKLRTQADEILTQVMAAADRLGIDRNNIALGKVTINMRYKQKKRRESDKFSHYELSQRVTITQTDIERYDEYWQEFTAIEGVRVGQNFFTSQLEPTRRQMRIDALNAAKEKAEDLAAVVGGSVGRALSISEFKPNPTQADIDLVANLTAVMGGGKPEKIEVSARVYVVFELQ